MSDDSVTCPICGQINHDLSEVCGGEVEYDTEIDCGHCGESFALSRTISISYKASPLNASKVAVNSK